MTTQAGPRLSNGAQAVVRALQDLDLRLVFGIPGTHNIEIYDALAACGIAPILVADERSAAFMADGAARVTGRPAVLNLVPGAGLSHALSGIAESYLDSVPMLVLASGIRNDTGHAFQLHAVDQLAMARPVVKATYPVDRPETLEDTIHQAYRQAVGGEPGPVVIEIPANHLMLGVPEQSPVTPAAPAATVEPDDVARAFARLKDAHKVGLYIGAGCRTAARELHELAAHLDAPVAWTFSGSGIYPADGAQAVWCGFGASAPVFAQNAFADVDVLLAIGCRFGEVATGSYGFPQPPCLIHVDINPDSLNRHMKADLALVADARAFLAALLPLVRTMSPRPERQQTYGGHRQRYLDQQQAVESPGKVAPEHFFRALRRWMPRNGVLTVDSGNHTFLAMEQFDFYEPGTCLGPFDFSCMGYSVPAAIGAKLAAPDRRVAAIVGDGSFLMTGTEIVTAVREGLGLPFFVFCDGTLGQISQFQKMPLNRSTCTDLSLVRLRGFAQAVGADFLEIRTDEQLTTSLQLIDTACAAGRPVIVGVAVDYSRKSAFTRGVVKTNLRRLPSSDRQRFLTRALARHTVDRPTASTPLRQPVATDPGCGRVLIVGQGAIGATLGAKLSEAGYQFAAVERNVALAKQISDVGVRLDGHLGTCQQRYPVMTELPEDALFDTILLITKSNDTVTAARSLLPHLAADGVIVSLQNGLNQEALAELVPGRQLIAGVIEFGADHHGDARITITSAHAELFIGRLDGSTDPQLQAVRELLNHALPTHSTANIVGHLWTKLLVNCFLNPLGALFSRPFGQLLTDPAIVQVCEGVVSEILRVSALSGMRLEKLKGKLPPRFVADPTYLRELAANRRLAGLPRLLLGLSDGPARLLRRLIFRRMAREIADVKSSMWQDLHAGRPSEIDYLNGHVVAIGARLGVTCPYNATLVRLIKEREQAGKDLPESYLKAALQDAPGLLGG
jgi:acetolactate synthase-1/2/3 large subunit